MTSPTPDPQKLRELAERLTKEMRGFLLMPFFSAEGIDAAWFHDGGDQLARKIYALGFATKRKVRVGTFAAIPTPLGHALRDYLLSLRSHLEQERHG